MGTLQYINLDILKLPPERVSDAQWDELSVFFSGERLSA
jgi:hypothetical protein